MNHYALLRNPGHNQVYYQQSAPLALAELRLSSLEVEQLRLEDCCGLSYLCFQTKAPLEEAQLEEIARNSSLLGLFATEGDALEKLQPIALPNIQVLDRSLGTILKYSGKTNEIFTRFLLNIAFSQGNFSPKHCKVLDPVAGKGTTLFEAFALGCDVYGVEYQEKAVQEGFLHLKKFLEKGKYKHKCDSRRFSGENKSFTAKRNSIQLSLKQQADPKNPNSQEFQREFMLVSGDSKYCHQLFSPNSFHVLVGDLPYGVQHGNQAGGISRSPAQLLSSCGKSWHKVLKKDGVLVLSWNTLVYPREKMEEALERAGFQVQHSEALSALQHPVDASILRDVVVAKKV